MAKTIEIQKNYAFTIGFYFQAMTRILGSPGRFFCELSPEAGFRQPFGCLVVSALFFAGASLTQLHENTIFMTAVFFTNSVAMPFITAGVGFLIMIMTIGKRVAFINFFALYAFSASITLLASWIPLFVWITEPWKWLLVATGMVKTCGFRWKQAVLIIGLSIFILVLFFGSLAPVVSYIKGHAG
jgi:hypothetical protein